MRAQRDAWQGIAAERLALGAPKPPQPEQKPMSWWRWLRTTGIRALSKAATSAETERRRMSLREKF
jgi:hypothetical protein